MKPVFRISLALFLLSLLAACGQSNLDKLNGAWQCDGKATIVLHPDAVGMGDMGEKMFSAITMKFDVPGKKLIMGLGARTKTEELAVVSDSGKTVVLGGSGSKLSIEFQNDDAILVQDDKDPKKKLILRRVK